MWRDFMEIRGPKVGAYKVSNFIKPQSMGFSRCEDCDEKREDM
jgi:hypothetical protein